MNILLVEDNEADAVLLTKFLYEKDPAIHMHWVMDGYEALDYVLQKGRHAEAPRPDFVLLDLGLPRIDGYEVLKEFKKYPQLTQLPVIVLTTSRNPLDRTQCMALGADLFLSKPYNLRGYETLIEQLAAFKPPLPQKQA